MARTTVVQVRMDDVEVALLDARRGRMTRSEAMRRAAEEWEGNQSLEAALSALAMLTESSAPELEESP